MRETTQHMFLHGNQTSFCGLPVCFCTFYILLQLEAHGKRVGRNVSVAKVQPLSPL